MAGYNLDKGFLILYDWLPLFQLLGGDQFKELLLALIKYQRDGIPLPEFENEFENAYAQAILPSIKRRLDGQAGAAKAKSAKDTDVVSMHGTDVVSMHGTVSQSRAERSRTEKSIPPIPPHGGTGTGRAQYLL